jgi:hypothetical protein
MALEDYRDKDRELSRKHETRSSAHFKVTTVQFLQQVAPRAINNMGQRPSRRSVEPTGSSSDQVTPLRPVW